MKSSIHSLIFFFILMFGVVLNSHAQNCQAGFTFGSTGLMIHFSDQSTPVGQITSWFWDFDDGTTSTLQNPMHVFPGPDKYDVCLTITTASGCTDEFCFRIEICMLNVSAVVGQCDAQGNVPVTVNITDLYDNAHKVNVSLDGQLLPGSPFEIESSFPVLLNLSVSGDGQQHEIFVISDDILTCIASYGFTVPDCTSDCFLSGMNVELADGAIHTVNIGNNFFNPVNTTIVIGDIVHFVWTTGGHTSTSDATTGPDSWNSGELGPGATYDVQLTNPGTHRYYCIPHGGPGGVGMSGMIIANCPPSGIFDLNITFSTTVANPAGYNLIIDGVVQPGSPHAYAGSGTQTVSATVAGDGQNHLIEIVDIADPTCSQSRNFIAPDCGAAPACSLSITADQGGGCNASNQVAVNVTVNSINGGIQGFQVLVDGNLVGGPFAYDPSGVTAVSVDIAGDGLSHIITTRDIADNDCQNTTTFISPNCTVPCAINNLTASLGTSITHVVAVQDFQFSPVNLTIAAGDLVEWVWTGSVEHTTTSDATTGPDSWNSGLLGTGATYTSPLLGAGVHPYYCIPHGGPGGIGMAGTITVQASCDGGQVAVALAFDEQGGGFSGYKILVDGPQVGGTFPYDPSGSNLISVNVAGDGQSHTIIVEDIENPNCTASITLTTPDCNATTCQLTATTQVTGACNAANQVPVAINVIDIGGGATFQVLVDDTPAGVFPYDPDGATTATVLINGDGQSHTIILFDTESPDCAFSLNITTPNCDLPCAINNLQVVPAGGGNPVSHTVQALDFEFFPPSITVNPGDTVHFVFDGHVPHTTTSDATSGPNAWNSGLLGHGATYDVVITTLGNHPYYCIPHGGPGGIGMAGTIVAVPPCMNDSVTASISFEAVNGAASGYDVLIDNVLYPGSPFGYAVGGTNSLLIQLPGDGALHSIAIADNADNGCSAEVSFEVIDCPEICQLTLDATPLGDCDNVGTIQYQLTVNAVNPDSMGFNIFIDNQPYSANPIAYDTSGTTTVSVMLPADGQPHEIRVEDAVSVNCTAMTTVQTPDCGGDCTLTLQAAQAGICDTNGNVPFQVNVGVTAPVGTGFNLSVDGVLWPGSPVDYDVSGTTLVNITLPGDGASHVIAIVDIGNAGCQASVAALTPDCSGNCSMGGFSVDINIPVTHEVLVRDFDFFPPDISVTVGDTIRFVWTGAVPHTSTSDATSGPDVWNSALLGQGAVFDVVIQSPGNHRYYCIPHGGPGGIGMAGIIRAADPCDDGALVVAVHFSAQNGSTNGYTVFLEDIPVFNGTYNPSGVNELVLNVPANGTEQHILIQDAQDPTCFLHEHFDMPDCNDPCFGFKADFSYQVNPQTLEVTFTDQTAGNPTGWMWDFGDGTTATVQNPSHVFEEGTYEVCLAVENNDPGCMDIICKTITVGLITCEPAFAYDNDGLTVFFNDQSITSRPITAWTWNLGNGQTISGISAPVYTYPTIGVYQVCLTIQADTCLATVCQELDLSNPCLAFEPNYSYTIDLENLLIQFSDETEGGPHRWLWGFGDGVTSTVQNPSHTYATPGVYTVCLLVQDTINGCSKAWCEVIYLGVTGTVDPPQAFKELHIYPNPLAINQGTLYLQGLLPEDINKDLSCRLYDLQGRMVYKEGLSGSETLIVPIPSTLAAGIYLVELRSENAVYRGRVVLR